MNGIKENSKMSLCKYTKHYKDDFNHSRYLKEVFGVFQYQGVDYINPNGIKIEFKECFKKYKPNKVRFAVYKKDLKSDYIVFIWLYSDFIYLHKTRLILRKYEFANKKQIAQPYFNTIRKNFLRKFTDLSELKIYLDLLEK